jgi:hypothetical protein
MSKNWNARNRSAAIYFLISLVIFLAGVLCTIWGNQSVPGPLDHYGKPIGTSQLSPAWFSIGTSLLAAGLVSLGFWLLRTIDDADSTELKEKLETLTTKVVSHGEYLHKLSTIKSDPSERCVSDDGISNVFKQLLDEHPQDKDLKVDVVGLKLHRFLRDQLKHLKAKAKYTKIDVRMLIQDPDAEAFSAICKLEARDEAATRADIDKTLRALSRTEERDSSLIHKDGNLEISARFFTPFQPIALFRVDDTIFVRPRVKSHGAGSRFYEPYVENYGGNYFELYKDHFEVCWEQSNYRKLEKIKKPIN